MRRLMWLVVILLLYVGSIGPVTGLVTNGTIPTPPKWLNTFYAPVLKLLDTPAGPLLLDYMDWWAEVLKKR